MPGSWIIAVQMMLARGGLEFSVLPSFGPWVSAPVPHGVSRRARRDRGYLHDGARILAGSLH